MADPARGQTLLPNSPCLRLLASLLGDPGSAGHDSVALGRWPPLLPLSHVSQWGLGSPWWQREAEGALPSHCSLSPAQQRTTAAATVATKCHRYGHLLGNSNLKKNAKLRFKPGPTYKLLKLFLLWLKEMVVF